MSLTITLILIVALCVAMTWTEGLWTNTVMFLNAVFSAIMASNYFEKLADFMDSVWGSATYFWDFLSLWFLFAFSFVVLRLCTDGLSKTRVRFKLPIDRFGAGFAGLAVGVVMLTFFLFSVHTAPLSRSPFHEAFQKEPESKNFFLTPDRQWLGFLQSRSEGAMSTSSSDPNVFDPQSEFILKYGERRQRFSEEKRMKVIY